MKNKIFSSLLIVLFVFGVCLLVKDQEGYLYTEDRPKAQIVDFINNPSFNSINSIMADQMYYRDDIINLFLNIYDKFSYGEKVVCYDREQIKINDIYYDNSYTRLDELILNTCANKAFNINEISNKYPEIKTYVYNPARYLSEPILDSVWFPNNYELFEETFKFYLGDKVNYKKLSYDDKDIKQLFYKTDHHYNSYGADKSYREIIEMISEDFDIESPKELIKINTINSLFRGSYSNVCENLDDIYDSLNSGEYAIDPNKYDYYVNGEKNTINAEKESILNNAYGNSRLYDAYFNSNVGEVLFDYRDNSKPNILIITDSYIGPIKEVLSSHFNKTIIECGDQGLNRFSLGKTIKDNEIDIILVLWFQQNLYYNGYYFIPIN